MDLNGFLETEAYEAFLALVNAELKWVARGEVDLEAPVDRFSVTLVMEFLAFSRLAVADLLALVRDSPGPAAGYVARKMEKYQAPQAGAGQAGEAGHEAASRIMPVGHLIEYLLIRDGGDLGGYLRAIQMPGAVEHELRLRRLYAEALAG